MPITIGGSASYRIANNIARTYNKVDANISHISSGLRASRLGEDVVTLSTGNMIKSDMSVLNQGIRNANDGISLLHTVDGVSQVIGNMLIRLKELAEQAATGTFSDELRKILNEDFQQTLESITQAAKSCQFNGITLIDGSTDFIKIHYGMENSNLKDYLEIKGQDFTADGLGVGALQILFQDDAQKALNVIDNAIIDLNTNRAHFGATMNRLEHTISTQGNNVELLYGHDADVSDTDIANEYSDLTLNAVKAQAALVALNSVNMTPHKALSVLSGKSV